MGYAPYKIPGKKYKYTIVYRDKRSNDVFQGHSEGRNWAEAGHILLESVTKNERQQKGLLTILDDFEVLFAYPGHIKSLV